MFSYGNTFTKRVLSFLVDHNNLQTLLLFNLGKIANRPSLTIESVPCDSISAKQYCQRKFKHIGVSTLVFPLKSYSETLFTHS